MLELKLSYDPDPARALENCRFWAPLSLPAETKHSLGDAAAMEAAADELRIVFSTLFSLESLDLSQVRASAVASVCPS